MQSLIPSTYNMIAVLINWYIIILLRDIALKSKKTGVPNTAVTDREVQV